MHPLIRRQKVPIATLSLTAALLLAGCSSNPATPTPNRSVATSSTQPGLSSAAASDNSSEAGSPTASNSRPATVVTIKIKNFAYTVSGPAKAGSKVIVTNNDGEAHTVTADSGKAFDTTIQSGKTGSITVPAQAGSYKFHCTFHSNMHGTLTVEK
jgi:plastocyanin